MPAEYSKPIKTLTVVQVPDYKCFRAYNIPYDRIPHLNMICIHTKNKEARFEPVNTFMNIKTISFYQNYKNIINYYLYGFSLKFLTKRIILF